MSQVYEIGMRIAVAGNALVALQQISQSLAGIHRRVGQIHSGFRGWAAVLGVGAVGGGLGIVGLLKKAADHGDDLIDQQVKLTNQGYKQADILKTQADYYNRIAKAIPTSTGASFLKTTSELRAVTGPGAEGLAKAAQLAEKSMKVDALLSNAFGTKKEGEYYKLLRAAEMKGVATSPEKREEFIDAAFSYISAFGGKLTADDFQTFARRGGTAFMNADVAKSMGPLAVLMADLRGSGAGTAAMTLQQFQMGAATLSKQQASTMTDLHLLDLSKTSKTGFGGSRLQLEPGAMAGSLEYAGDLPGWIRDVVWPKLKEAAHGDKALLESLIAKIAPNRNAAKLIHMFGDDGFADQIAKDQGLSTQALKIDPQYDNFIEKNPKGAKLGFHDQFTSMMQAIGGPLAQAAIPLMQSLTRLFTSIGTWANANPEKIKLIGEALVGLGVGLAALGAAAVIAAAAALIPGGVVAVAVLAIGSMLASLAGFNWEGVKAALGGLMATLTGNEDWRNNPDKNADQISGQVSQWFSDNISTPISDWFKTHSIADTILDLFSQANASFSGNVGTMGEAIKKWLSENYERWGREWLQSTSISDSVSKWLSDNYERSAKAWLASTSISDAVSKWFTDNIINPTAEWRKSTSIADAVSRWFTDNISTPASTWLKSTSISDAVSAWFSANITNPIKNWLSSTSIADAITGWFSTNIIEPIKKLLAGRDQDHKVFPGGSFIQKESWSDIGKGAGEVIDHSVAEFGSKMRDAAGDIKPPLDGLITPISVTADALKAGDYGTALHDQFDKIGNTLAAFVDLVEKIWDRLQSTFGGGAGGGIMSASYTVDGDNDNLSSIGRNRAASGSGAFGGAGNPARNASLANAARRGGLSGYGNSPFSSKSDLVNYIRDSAVRHGVDPDIAVRVANSEGLSKYVGDFGTSFGPYQLHYGGSGIRGMNANGLGDVFTRLYHKDARDRSTVKEQIDFALGYAKTHGWGDWHGAAKVGIGRHQGLNRRPMESENARSALPEIDKTLKSDRNRKPITSVPLPQKRQPDPIIQFDAHLDGDVLARSSTRRQSKMAMFPTSSGDIDPYSRWHEAGQRFSDVG